MSILNNKLRDKGQMGLVTLVLVVIIVLALVGGRHFFHNTGHDIRTTFQDAGHDLKSTGRDAAQSIRDTVQ